MDLFTMFGHFGIDRIFYDGNVKSDEDINFLFFVCPRMKNPGITIKRSALTAKYVPGLSGYQQKRIARIKRFFHEAESFYGARSKVRINFDIKKAIFAAADSFILFSPPLDPPREVPNIPEIEVVSNIDLYKKREGRFTDILYHERPWEKIPAWVLDTEEKRLRQLLPVETSREVKQEFIQRVFAGFALDGLVIREGVFGGNPVILGIESPGVGYLQNASLKPEERIPVIQLK